MKNYTARRLGDGYVVTKPSDQLINGEPGMLLVAVEPTFTLASAKAQAHAKENNDSNFLLILE